MQQRLREAREDALIRSVGRANGHKRWWDRYRRKSAVSSGANGSASNNGASGNEATGRLRRGHAEVDFHDRGEDVWKALRY